MEGWILKLSAWFAGALLVNNTFQVQVRSADWPSFRIMGAVGPEELSVYGAGFVEKRDCEIYINVEKHRYNLYMTPILHHPIQ
jgi:hypothetical protein